MRPFLICAFFFLITALGWSHPMPSSAVRLQMHATGVDAILDLPIVELRLGWQQPLPMDAGAAVRQYGERLEGYVVSHVRPVSPDGRPWTVVVKRVTPVTEAEPDIRIELAMMPPAGAPADRFTFNYDVIFHQLITHEAVVSIERDWRNGLLGEEKPVILGTMRDTNRSIVVDRSEGTWFRGFASVFHLGARHIAEGTDHLLFLLALLLPAPLVAAGRRWGGFGGGRAAFRKIVKVVTAFTVGHSLTLILGALGWVRLPSAFIESVIALSILVSAIHALVPIFRGKEILIAGGFGLVHGLAFAQTLAGFGFDTVTMVSSVLGFNLGIEAFQILVIAVTMPWLVLLARTRVYAPFRVLGAVVTGVAAAAWFFERALGWPNPIGPLVESAALRGLWIVVGIAVLSIVAWKFAPRADLASSA